MASRSCMISMSYVSAQAEAFGRSLPRARLQVARASHFKESRVGIRPIVVPNNVTIDIQGPRVSVKGPKGSLERAFSSLVDIKQDDGVVRLVRRQPTRVATQQHGLARSLLNAMVVGVSQGVSVTLKLVGVGYRAAVSGRTLVLSLGYSHPVEVPIPPSVSIAVERSTTITIQGPDKEVVGQCAATIRSKRPPEPYKGKGVRYADEVVRRKEGKKGK